MQERAPAAAIGRGAVEAETSPEVEIIGRPVARARAGALPGGADRSLERVRASLADGSVRFLLVMLFAAQAADLLTTHVALQRQGMLERNPLFRMLFTALPGVADVIKLSAVLGIVLLALSLLPLPRARHAMLFAAAISMVAPIANVMTLLGRF